MVRVKTHKKVSKKGKEFSVREHERQKEKLADLWMKKYDKIGLYIPESKKEFKKTLAAQKEIMKVVDKAAKDIAKVTKKYERLGATDTVVRDEISMRIGERL